jgi:hypothetical protein
MEKTLETGWHVGHVESTRWRKGCEETGGKDQRRSGMREAAEVRNFKVFPHLEW